MGWKTSVSEAVIYVMVIGLSVDYVIHLGRTWQDILKHFHVCELRFTLEDPVAAAHANAGL